MMRPRLHHASSVLLTLLVLPLQAEPPDTGKGLLFLHHADPQFLEGLRRHDMLRNWGYRLHNTSYDKRPFRDKWTNNPLLEAARRSGRYYYIDRITGGMPYQQLDGIEEIAARLEDDPHFLGFQVHEWGHSPMADYRRIQELFVKKGLPLTRENFATLADRTETPYLASGGFEPYGALFRSLTTTADVHGYLEDFMRHMVRRTAGQVMAVNGYVQLYDEALRLGAENVMAEIGNQVQLTALQIACVRGAARQHRKRFGVYYEPWGGRPFGCPCAIGWSPWLATRDKPDRQLDEYQIRPGLGSSASLHRRLLYYAWLSGATYIAEEWGAENTFGNWTDYPLTEYGRITKEFIEVTGRFTRPQPIVPAAVVLPPGACGIDLQYISGEHEELHRLVPPDTAHRILRQFVKNFLAPQPKTPGMDSYNLTPSPWIGTFDVIRDVPASATGTQQYRLLVFMEQEQMKAADGDGSRKVLYQNREGDAAAVTDALRPLLRYEVQGEVGAAHATIDGRYVIGIFNNLGITKTEGKEVADPAATRVVTILGPTKNPETIVGSEYIALQENDRIRLQIPAGGLAVLAFEP